MKKVFILIFIGTFLFLGSSHAIAKGGFYLGVLAGYSAQKPSLKDVEFGRDSTFLLGARAGIKVMMIAVEACYFQAAHNLELKEFATLDWGDRQVDYNFVGLNLKYFFPMAVLHPYITLGYGIYTADIKTIDKDSDKGINFGLGLELQLGSKFSFLAEGKYHHVKLDIDEKDLKLGDFTVCGGLNIYF